MQRAQALIAGAWTAMALALQMHQEVEHNGRREILDAQSFGSNSTLVTSESQQQCEGISIRADGMLTQVALTG
jgi:hypothetical protein